MFIINPQVGVTKTVVDIFNFVNYSLTIGITKKTKANENLVNLCSNNKRFTGVTFHAMMTENS